MNISLYEYLFCVGAGILWRMVDGSRGPIVEIGQRSVARRGNKRDDERQKLPSDSESSRNGMSATSRNWSICLFYDAVKIGEKATLQAK